MTVLSLRNASFTNKQDFDVHLLVQGLRGELDEGGRHLLFAMLVVLSPSEFV